MPNRTCSIDGCTKPARTKSAELCPMHYHRWYRYGDPGEAAERRRRRRSDKCSIDGCAKPDMEAGLCSMHGARKRRHGDPLKVIAAHERDLPTGQDHHNWVGDDAGYETVHDRISRSRGKASNHACADCGGDAYHWSYDHEDPGELLHEYRPGMFSAYSLDETHYHPRCVRCHKAFDLGRVHSTAV